MSVLQLKKSWFRLLGKYGVSSLSATGVDFWVFHLALSWAGLPAVQATFTGRCIGSVVSFLLQRSWVFSAASATQWPLLAVRYAGGVFLGMVLNVGGVWLLHDACGWQPWPARISAASTCWFIIFLFNHRVVFNPEPNR